MIDGATPEGAKDSVRTAAAIMLAYAKHDVPLIQAISESTDGPSLLSGLMFVSGLIAMEAFREDMVPAMEQLVEFLALAPDEFWTTMVQGATTVRLNTTEDNS